MLPTSQIGRLGSGGPWASPGIQPPIAGRVGDSRTVHADIKRFIETPVALPAGAGLIGKVIRNVLSCPFTRS